MHAWFVLTISRLPVKVLCAPLPADSVVDSKHFENSVQVETFDVTKAPTLYANLINDYTFTRLCLGCVFVEVFQPCLFPLCDQYCVFDAMPAGPVVQSSRAVVDDIHTGTYTRVTYHIT